MPAGRIFVVLATASVLANLLGACATGVATGPGGVPTMAFQNKALNPRNGGVAVQAESLRPGDILLSSGPGMQALGVQLITTSSVSHASLVTGDGLVAEAVGQGIRQRTVAQLLQEELTVVAFRHPGVQPQHARKMDVFVREHLGQSYNFVGVMLQAPFSLERRLCELPLVPAAVRDACIQGVAAIQLGAGSNDRFFCSQFVLEAYRRAGLPLTDADPRLVSPGDLLHMREGDVPSIRIHQALQYVGHLKFQAPAE